MNPSILFLVTFSVVLTQNYAIYINTTKTLSVPLEPRVVGGYDAHLGQFPYQVLLISDYGNLNYLCGGVILSSRYVLTAAHCVQGLSNTRVYAGILKISERGWPTAVRMIHYHFVDNSLSQISDIALLELASDLPIDGYRISAISIRNNAVAPNTYCTISGWGKLVEDGSHPDIMQYVSLQVVDKGECYILLGNGILPWDICVGYRPGGIGPCKGDSGGPLVCDGLLTGVASRSQGCARKNKPALYTDVYYHIDWLKSIMGSDIPNTGSNVIAHSIIFLVYVPILMRVLSSLVYYHYII